MLNTAVMCAQQRPIRPLSYEEAIEFVETKDINDYPLLKKEVEANNLFRG